LNPRPAASRDERAPLPAALTVRVLKRGPWGKADILALGETGTEMILKDFSDKSRLVRWFGGRQLRHERRALRRLAGLQGIPAVLGALPPCGLLLEPMPGSPITRWRRRPVAEILPMLDRLEALVARIHERGIAHLDLRKRDNILVSDDGRPGVIDFNASVLFRPGSLASRIVFPWLRRVDHAALLKWRSLLLPDHLTPSERRRHRRMSRLRRLWIFN
jgi:predicted Ser/Thr protein kinase